MTKLLLVEDDPSLGKGLQVNLELEGYEVSWAESLKTARSFLASSKYDLMLLDLNLSDGSGLSLARECQVSAPELPIVILTASSDEDSVVSGFEVGALDYVRKPFGNSELKARIRVALKKKPKSDTVSLQFENLSIVPEKRLAKYGSTILELNRREFDILCHFVANAENVITRETLLSLFDRDGEIFDRTIDSHISHLRSRLKKAGVESIQIISIYGVGYRLERKQA